MKRLFVLLVMLFIVLAVASGCDMFKGLSSKKTGEKSSQAPVSTRPPATSPTPAQTSPPATAPQPAQEPEPAPAPAPPAHTYSTVAGRYVLPYLDENGNRFGSDWFSVNTDGTVRWHEMMEDGTYSIDGDTLTMVFRGGELVERWRIEPGKIVNLANGNVFNWEYASDK